MQIDVLSIEIPQFRELPGKTFRVLIHEVIRIGDLHQDSQANPEVPTILDSIRFGEDSIWGFLTLCSLQEEVEMDTVKVGLEVRDGDI